MSVWKAIIFTSTEVNTLSFSTYLSKYVAINTSYRNLLVTLGSYNTTMLILPTIMITYIPIKYNCTNAELHTRTL